MVPPMTGGMGPPPELKRTEQKKKLHGFDAALYTFGDRGQTLEIWATNDGQLFPFRLIERDQFANRFGPQMLEEQWATLLRDKSLFPLQATLRMEGGGAAQFTFAAEKIDKKKISDEKLFQPPEKYLEIQAPPF